MPSDVHGPVIPPAELDELVTGIAGVEAAAAAAEVVATVLVVFGNRGAAEDEAAMTLVTKLVAEVEAVSVAKPTERADAPLPVVVDVGAEPGLLLPVGEAGLLVELPPAPPWHCPCGQQLEPVIGTNLRVVPPQPVLGAFITLFPGSGYSGSVDSVVSQSGLMPRAAMLPTHRSGKASRFTSGSISMELFVERFEVLAVTSMGAQFM